ncbi:MAG: hypothetical protein ACQETA_04285 [Bacteroidota bacterium]
MKKNSKKTVVIVAECWNGASEAGRFAARNLFDDSTRIILLHSYKRPATGIMMIRNITPRLRQIAEEELLSLKKELVQEMKLPEKNIENIVQEGDLKSIIRSVCEKHADLSIVLGPGTGNMPLSGPCKKIISAVMESRSVPIFMVSEFITIVEESRITVIAEEEGTINEAYLDFLKDFSGKNGSGVKVIARDNSNKVNIDRKTARHFAVKDQSAGEPRTAIEQVLVSRLVQANTA